MKLLTKANLAALPPLRSTENQGDEAVVHVKWFTPDANWTWYVTEYDPETGECFGLVKGLETELGYFNIREIAQIKGRLNLPVERDLHFGHATLGDVRAGRAS